MTKDAKRFCFGYWAFSLRPLAATCRESGFGGVHIILGFCDRSNATLYGLLHPAWMRHMSTVLINGVIVPLVYLLLSQCTSTHQPSGIVTASYGAILPDESTRTGHLSIARLRTRLSLSTSTTKWEIPIFCAALIV